MDSDFNKELCPGEDSLISECVQERGKRKSSHLGTLGWMWQHCYYQNGEGKSPNWTENLTLENVKEHK